MLTRSIWVLPLLLLVSGCNRFEETTPSRLTLGIVSYGESDRSLENFANLRDHLGSQLKSIIELEPTFNEVRAMTQIQERKWDLVFAPPGLAAIAIDKENYLPVFPLEGVEHTRSVIVVREDSSVESIQDLAGKTVALGQVGSATGYYLPIYNLYGLTLAEVRFAPTPKQILGWLEEDEVAAGALSLAEFNRFRSEFSETGFRIINTDSHQVPSGVILVGETVELNLHEQIKVSLSQVPPSIASEAGFIPNGKLPDYSYMIEVVDRVNSIAERIKEKPAPLYERKSQ